MLRKDITFSSVKSFHVTNTITLVNRLTALPHYSLHKAAGSHIQNQSRSLFKKVCLNVVCVYVCMNMFGQETNAD
jgi:hypothetical protein